MGLNLCPFARHSVVNDLLRVTLVTSHDVANILTVLADEMTSLAVAPDATSTTLLVLEKGFDEFDDYLDLVAISDALLEDLGFSGVLQLATFHPHYQFEGLKFDDAANYTNRSPAPMLHLLQERAVTLAVDNHDDVSAIPARNEATMRSLSQQELDSLSKP